ncbi:MAG: peptidylprolyl isomerase [Gemmataceae bacterium]
MASIWSHWLKRAFRRTPTARRSRRFHPLCHRLESRETPALFSGGVHTALGSAGLVAGAGAGGVPVVAVYDPTTGAQRVSFLAFDAKFSGGVFVAAGSDGNIVAGAGAGGVPMVSVFDSNGNAKASFLAFDSKFNGGVRVAYADVNGDGTADVIAAAGPGGKPQVRVFSGKDYSTVLYDFAAFNSAFTGGVTVAAADLTGDGKAEIVAGATSGGVPLVRVFDGASGSATASFMAFDKKFNGGISVAATSADGGRIMVGASIGGVPVVSVFDENGTVQKEFFAFDSKFNGGVWTATGDANSDGTTDIIVGANSGGQPGVRVFSGATNASILDFFAFQDVITGPGNPSNPSGDITPPTLTLISPALNQTFSANPTIQGKATDNVGVTKLEVQVDNVNSFQSLAFAADGSFSYTPSVTTDGNHSVYFRAFDAAGNVSQYLTFAYTLRTDSVAPTVTITSPTNGQTFATNPIVNGTASDNVGVTAVEARVDGGAFTNAAFNPTAGTYSFTTSLATDGSADGPHTVDVRARDAAGNLSALASVTFTLDSAFALTANLDAASDTGTPGNNITELSTVTVSGKTEPNAVVSLVGGSVTTTADSEGKYNLANVTLTTGQNTLTIRSTLNGQSRDTNLVATLNVAPTAPGVPASFSVAQNSGATLLNLPEIFSDGDVNSLVTFNTNFGSFDVELFDQQVGTTTANFLKYAGNTTTSGGNYDSTIIHRVTRKTSDPLTNDGIAVLQGGGYKFTANPGALNHIATDAAIALQDALTNSNGTLSMARTPQANSATSEFFINTASNTNLDHGGQGANSNGYAVFGVIRSGRSVVDAMEALTEQDRGGVFNEIPLQNYPNPPAGNFPTDTTSANYAFVNSVSIVRQTVATNPDSLTFTVLNNSNPSLVNAQVSNGILSLSYTAGQSGQATITLRATDRNGITADATFTVTVV